MQNNIARNQFFDIIRAVCILEIVAYWHIKDYFYELQFSHLYALGVPLTLGALTMFSFISGYLCSYNGNAGHYVSKRAIRILLPLSIAYYLMVSTGYISDSKKDFLLTITGLHPFFLPYPATLWYISMTIFFYAITPFIESAPPLKS